jgi:hypothetical protein
MTRRCELVRSVRKRRQSAERARRSIIIWAVAPILSFRLYLSGREVRLWSLRTEPESPRSTFHEVLNQVRAQVFWRPGRFVLEIERASCFNKRREACV